MDKKLKVAVIGGGLTGLSSAYYLEKNASQQGIGIDVTLIEAGSHFGGKINTVQKDGFVIERGPDSFLKRKRAALDLIEDLGLTDQVVSNQTGKAFILKNARLHPIPEASVMGVPTQLAPIMHSDLLTDAGKAAVLNDLILPRQTYAEDISVGEFFRKRLGEELVDHIISPLLSGIYAGNINKLSLAATQPQFLNVEKTTGSLILGLNGKAPKTKPKEGQFATLRKGLRSLVEAMVAEMKGKCLLNTKVDHLTASDNGYRIHLNNGEKIDTDYIIVTTPVQEAYRLLPNATFLIRDDADKNTSVATIAMAFNEEDVSLPEEGTGFVVSRKEPVPITASTWTHLKWPHTVPQGKCLLRAYVGKAGEEHVLNNSDEALTSLAVSELQKVFPITGDPLFSVVSRWPDAMPQYGVGHKNWLEEVDRGLSKLYPGVYVAGASYDGVGLPDCIRQGKEKAEKILKSI